jgi:hypothetical protein
LVVKQDATVELDRRVDEIKHVLAESTVREPNESNRVTWFGFVGDQGVRGLNPELRFRRPGGRTPA